MNFLYAKPGTVKPLPLARKSDWIRENLESTWAFDTILEINPENSVAWHREIYFVADGPEEALGLLIALDFDPDNVYAF